MLKAHHEYKIKCLDMLTYAGNLSTLKDIMTEPNFRFVKLDIFDREGVYALFEEEHPDSVVTSLQRAMLTGVSRTLAFSFRRISLGLQY